MSLIYYNLEKAAGLKTTYFKFWIRIMVWEKKSLILNDMPGKLFNWIFNHFFDILSGLFNKWTQKYIQLNCWTQLDVESGRQMKQKRSYEKIISYQVRTSIILNIIMLKTNLKIGIEGLVGEMWCNKEYLGKVGMILCSMDIQELRF